MIISLLPTTALAAEENDVWSKEYGTIRVYLDSDTEEDYNKLGGDHIRIMSEKYLAKDGDDKGMRACWRIFTEYWFTTNARGIKAKDIDSVVLAKNNIGKPSDTISIPIKGDTTYKVEVSQGHHEGVTSIDSYNYLRIYISRRTPHAVKYEFASPAPENVSVPVDTTKYTETSPVTLLDPTETSVTGTHEGHTGIWTFNGWTVKGDQTNTQISQADKKFIMPDENVTVTGKWTFEATPPTGTSVYVYFQTVNTAGDPIKNDVKGVIHNKNGNGWATLGKLTTTADVATANAADIGKEVKDVNDDPNTNFERYKVNENVINGNVGISLIDWKSIVLEPNGAAGYESEAPLGTDAWHLNGKVKVYKLSYNANLPGGVTASVTVPDPAYYLPNATVSTDDPTLQGYNFEGWYTEETFEHKVEKTVTVSKDTVLYAKWTPAQPTADLVDDAITIYHKVSDRSDWHGGNAYADASAHQAGRTPTISYKAKLDLSEMKLQKNNRTASIIAAYGEKPWEKLVETVKSARGSLAMFSGSKIVLHVQLDKQLSTADIQNQLNLNNIKVTSDWFELSKAGNPVVYDENAQSLTITCVPKIKADGYDSTITLSGLNDLSLTSILSSGETRALTASGYITGSILISVPTVKVNAVTVETEDLVDAVQHGNGELYLNESIPLVLGSKTATNTAKLYWKEIKDNDDDDDDKYFFAIQKVDAQDGHALNGATFELYQLDKNGKVDNRSVTKTRQQGSKNGIALFSVDNKNSYDGIWYYAEVTAPEGYVLDTKEYEISAGDFYYDDQSKAVAKAKTVRNYRGTTPDLLNDSDHFAYVIGYMDGNVRPYGLISRAETTTIFFRLLKDSVRDGNLLTSNTYTDVPDDYWANTAISTMTGLGIVQGRSTTTFDPKAPITRAQFAAICARFDTGKTSGTQSFTDTKGHWAEKYIERAAELGWIKGFEDGTFRPDTYITRAQAMTMINRVLNRIPEEESDLLPGMNVWPDCNPGDWFYLAVQEATNSHDFEHKAGNYETWTKLMKNPNWTRYEN